MSRLSKMVGDRLTRARIIAAAALVLLLALAAGFGSWFALSVSAARARVEHSHLVARATDKVMADLLNAETGQRGFLLTGREEYLQPFTAAAPAVSSAIAQLRTLTADNPAQSERLTQLDGLAQAKLGELRRAIELRRGAGIDAAVAAVNGDQGKRAMDDIRGVLAQMRADEARLLDERTAAAAVADDNFLRAGIIGGVLALVAFVYGAYLLRQAEREIQSKSAGLRATLDSVPQGVMLCDAQGRIAEWNARLPLLLGTRIPLVRGKTRCAELQTDLAARVEAAPKVFATGSAERTEFVVGTRYLEAIGSTLATGGAIYTVHDATERRLSERVAVQSQRLEAVGQMAGGIAHDFNNLFTAVIGNLDLAAAKVADQPPIARMLERAALAAERGRKLVAQLLSFGRKRSFQAELIEPRALVENMRDVIQATLGANAPLKLELEDVREQVLIDRGQLELGILNLVLNARDAMRDAGGQVAGELTLALTTSDVATPNARLGGIAPGRYVCIAVRDTGTGMSEQVQARAFEPFYTTKGVGEGSGLGLSQTYGVVKQSGGAVVLDSAVGRGTTVTLYLPAASATALAEREAARQLAALPRLAGGGRGSRVLVVEDDDLVRDFVVRTLRGLGYDVLEAGDGDAAWEIIAAADRIDLLCTDIMMPGSMNGFDLARRARQRRPDLRLVYMSGYPDKALESAKPSNGNVPYLAKPFRANDLAAGVKRAMEA
jgi:signal transduction histidine kinase/CheY-like chemotaxis protein